MPDKRTLPERPGLLLARLRDVVQRAGGVTRATELTGVSRAQLTRYLQGTSDMKLDNLVALAQGLNVPIGWLMGDVGSTKLSWLDAASDIRRNTAALLRVLQRFDTPRTFQSHEIASIIELMVISQHHGRETSGIELPLAERDIFDGLTYVSTMRTADCLDVYVDGCRRLVSHGLAHAEPWANRWASIIEDAVRLHFNSKALKDEYFLRLNVPIWAAHLSVMQGWVTTMVSRLGGQGRPIDVLDAGCGNGRHLVYLHNLGNMFRLHGIDTADVALELCQEHERKDRLPTGCTQKADMMKLPFADDSMDVYMSLANFQFLPLMRGSFDIGVGRALAEAARVVRPGGLILVLMQASKVPSEFFPRFRMHHDRSNVEELLNRLGLKALTINDVENKEPDLPGFQFGRGVYCQEVWVIEKPAKRGP